MSKSQQGGRRGPTLATVASTVGVSAMTVSNAFGRPEKVSVELRERILAAAAEVGYLGPDPMAQSLRRGRVGALGLLLGESLGYAFEDPGAMQLLQGVARGCGERAVGLYLVPTTGTDSDRRLIQNAAVDALILFGLPDDHPLVATALSRGIPVLTSGGPLLTEHHFVGIDERAAAQAAARHVIELGHRDLAVISFPLGNRRHEIRSVSLARQRRATFRVARERLHGFRDAWRTTGRPWSDVAVYEVPINSRAAGHDAALAILQAAPRSTAILAMSDELALGALAAAEELGTRVPADLSVVGWDDNPNALVSRPPLTTVRQSLSDQGKLLAELALQEKSATLIRIEPGSLVIRSSTGPAPQQKPDRDGS